MEGFFGETEEVREGGSADVDVEETGLIDIRSIISF